jgi:ubiquinone/menaquinone biosynthesis C-methylase UbiE
MREPHRFRASERSLLTDDDRRRRQPPEAVLDRTEIRDGQLWIDLGCGVGYFTIPLRDRGVSAVAIDAQREMLEELGSRAGTLDRICMVQSDFPPVPLRDGSADRVLMVNVLHEIADRRLLASEIRRVLKPSGRIVVVDFQKMDTPGGPPLRERLSPEEACQCFEGFLPISRRDTEDHYQLELGVP